MDSREAQRAAKWILNTTLDSDKIAEYLNLSKQDKIKLQVVAKKLRAEQGKQCQLQS